VTIAAVGDTRATVEAACRNADLDAGASALAAAPWPEVSREAVALAGRVARACRGRGWEDPDLVRMARRELGAEHVRLAEALAAEAAAEPAEPDRFLEAYGRRERLDRFGTATVVLELLRLYGRLPAITPPAAPGRAKPVGGGHRMLGRIRALLAKAESTEFPEEAEALSAKAQHLMARHSIGDALLPEHAADGPTARRIGVDPPYEGARALLLDAVAEANRCQAVWSSDFGFSTVVGYEADLDAVELLYTSLLVQADAGMLRGGSKSRNFRQSFLIAYAGRIRDRLGAATEAEAAATPEVLPVLATREVAVGAATERMFPSTTTHRLKGRDAEGWERGTAAADRAALKPRSAVPGSHC
jgi:hypothetical protein